VLDWLFVPFCLGLQVLAVLIYHLHDGDESEERTGGDWLFYYCCPFYLWLDLFLVRF
jgi:hypothetical protein